MSYAYLKKIDKNFGELIPQPILDGGDLRHFWKISWKNKLRIGIFG